MASECGEEYARIAKDIISRAHPSLVREIRTLSCVRGAEENLCIYSIIVKLFVTQDDEETGGISDGRSYSSSAVSGDEAEWQEMDRANFGLEMGPQSIYHHLWRSSAHS